MGGMREPFADPRLQIHRHWDEVTSKPLVTSRACGRSRWRLPCVLGDFLLLFVEQGICYNQPDQFGQILSLRFLKNVVSSILDGPQADLKSGCNLLVLQPIDHHRHDLAFLLGQAGQTHCQVFPQRPLLGILLFDANGASDGTQQFLPLTRLAEYRDGSLLKESHGVTNAVVSGKEHRGRAYLHPLQTGMKLASGHSG